MSAVPDQGNAQLYEDWRFVFAKTGRVKPGQDQRRPSAGRSEYDPLGAGERAPDVRVLEGEVAALRRCVDRWAALSEELTRALEASRKELARTRDVLDEVTSSKAWRLAQHCRKVVYGSSNRESDGGSD